MFLIGCLEKNVVEITPIEIKLTKVVGRVNVTWKTRDWPFEDDETRLKMRKRYGFILISIVNRFPSLVHSSFPVYNGLYIYNNMIYVYIIYNVYLYYSIIYIYVYNILSVYIYRCNPTRPLF